MNTMNQLIHDQKNGLTYTLCGDYYFPDLNLSDADKTPIGHYGRMNNIRQRAEEIVLTKLIYG